MREENAGGVRPNFPKRAIVTAGMPYGNKPLHIGHIGGVFVPADCYARFLRDRIGEENVLFLSGTDCYGSPIMESFRKRSETNDFADTLEEYVAHYHARQKETLEAYRISLDLYGASALGRAGEIHRRVSGGFIRRLYENGHLERLSAPQFYDEKLGVFLNGRQVTGRCPIAGCASEFGYADECSLGHSYQPWELIGPKSALSGETPSMREVENWYFRLEEFHGLLSAWLRAYESEPTCRAFAAKSIREFLEAPVVHVKRELFGLYCAVLGDLPPHTLVYDAAKPSFALSFERLSSREEACARMKAAGISFRTGKTLVPFRLTGNISWGVPAPELEGLSGRSVWVWPESLWAPISFTMAALEARGEEPSCWKDWWCSGDALVYQFIGQDNVFFYGPAQTAMFLAVQGPSPAAEPPAGGLRATRLVVNHHLLFLDRKASSSGSVKAPDAGELLSRYTAEQLRIHFLALGLGVRNAGFKPKPFNPDAGPNEADPALKEGNLLTNVLNRVVRSCFYTAQKHEDGRIPLGEVSLDALGEARECVLAYERLMHRCELHQVVSLLDTYIRSVNRRFTQGMREADAANSAELRRQTLIDGFHGVRTATALMHPIAPEGTELVREYLGLGRDFWSWGRIFEPLRAFLENPAKHRLKFLAPRADFFKKHPSQVGDGAIDN
ncbi:MAG TPA: class I tRNA ligase family protein [Clostridia bacterium]|nr:class I tRNA ligase family protein [Clostridia bacterium]